MKLRWDFAYTLSCAFLLTALIAGCSPTRKNIVAELHPPPIIEEESVAYIEIVEEVEEEEFVEPEIEEAEAIDSISDIDDFLRVAREFCSDGRFASADTMLRRAATVLLRSNTLAETKWVPLNEYVADIIDIYTEQMPEEFPLPKEILTITFNRYLFGALDTLNISAKDSIILHRLSTKQTVYDVPMVWNDRVRHALLFFMRTRSDRYDRWLARASYWLPIKRQMFADAGLPQDLAYLPIIESAFNPHAYSRAHAAGIWQFIPSTGTNYGLRQNHWIDERRDPLKSAEAATAYLSKLYSDFGDWHIALASYNCGENGMARAIRRADGIHDYWQLTLPKETMNYIPLYLASVIIAKNPEMFEFTMQDTATFDRDTAWVNNCIQFKTIAAGIDVHIDTLRRMNSHILHDQTPPDMQNVRLYFPAGYGDKFREFYRDLPDEHKTKFHRYRVQGGDNIASVARAFRVPAETIRDVNNISGNHITAGRHIIIPVPVNDTVPRTLARHLNTTDRQQQRAHAQRQAAGNRQMTGAGQRTGTGQQMTYRVRSGETLHSIARLFGVSINDLMAWNNISNPRDLKAGQTLVVRLPDAQRSRQQVTVQRAAGGDASAHTGKHLVRQGETLYGISQLVGISVSELANINGLDPRRPRIFPGDILVYTPRIGQTTQIGGATASVTTNTGIGQNTQSATTQPSSPGNVTLYTVRTGDNLWRIASNFGVTVDSIRAENNLSANVVLMPGDVLRIKR